MNTANILFVATALCCTSNACREGTSGNAGSSQVPVAEVSDPPRLPKATLTPDAQSPNVETAKHALPKPEGTMSRDCDSIVRGISDSELQARYGKPDKVYEFMATEGPGEMRVEILNDYPPSDPASATTKIIEHSYTGDGYYFVLWLHEKNGQWEGLQAISYDEGVEF